MIDESAIRGVVERAVAAAEAPCKAIVFGSYGRGDADDGSDLDLLIVERQLSDQHTEYMRIRRAIGRVAPGVGVDLLVCSNEEFERRAAVPGTVYFWARAEGKVFYDAAG